MSIEGVEINNFDLDGDDLSGIYNFVDMNAQHALSDSSSISSIRECKLFLTLQAVSGIPKYSRFLGITERRFFCVVEVLKDKTSFALHQSGMNYTHEYRNKDPKHVYVWDLPEYFGETKVKISIMYRMWCQEVVVGTNTIRLSELLRKQQLVENDNSRNRSAPLWDVPFHLTVNTSLKSRFANKKNVYNNCLEGTSRNNKDVSEKDFGRGRDYKYNQLSQLYISGGNKKKRCLELSLLFRFRFVSLLNCTTPSLMRSIAVMPDKCSTPTIVTGSYINCIISEFHHLVASAPANVVVKVMKDLAIKRVLARTLEQPTIVVTTALEKSGSNNNNETNNGSDISVRGLSSMLLLDGKERGRAVGSSSSNKYCINPFYNSNSTIGYYPIDCALLSRQNLVVLELLRRCGPLCFQHVMPAQGCPLHSAVLGGSPTCVEYLCRYLKRYGNTVTTTRRGSNNITTAAASSGGAALWRTGSNFATKLEWKDALGYTPLALACCMIASTATTTGGDGGSSTTGVISVTSHQYPNGENGCLSSASPAFVEVVKVLLFYGADPAAVNPISGYTPLMCVCSVSGSGNNASKISNSSSDNRSNNDDIRKVVRILLNSIRSAQEIHEALLSTNYPSTTTLSTTTTTTTNQQIILQGRAVGVGGIADFDVTAGAVDNHNNITTASITTAAAARGGNAATNINNNIHTSALAMHLRYNSRSRNTLKNRDRNEGGYFNPLSIYCCQPAYVERIHGRQAVHIAAVAGHHDVVAMLLDINVSLTDTDFAGDNLFHIAAYQGDTQLMQLLIDTERRRYDAYRIEIQDGRSLNSMYYRLKPLLVRNTRGKLPVDIAWEEEHYLIAELLIVQALIIYDSSNIDVNNYKADNSISKVRNCISTIKHNTAAHSTNTNRINSSNSSSNVVLSHRLDEHLKTHLAMRLKQIKEIQAAADTIAAKKVIDVRRSVSILLPEAANTVVRQSSGSQVEEKNDDDDDCSSSSKTNDDCVASITNNSIKTKEATITNLSASAACSKNSEKEDSYVLITDKEQQGEECDSSNSSNFDNLIDDVADQIEYQMALSALGSKYLSDYYN